MHAAATAGALLAAASPLQAHDFWIEPQAFVAPAGSRLGFALKVGHRAQRMRSALPAARIVEWAVVSGPAGADRPTTVLRPGGTAVDGWIAAMPAGRAMLALQSDASAISRLDAERFNAHVRDEGLREVQAHRAAEGRWRAVGVERYSRHAKALVDGGCQDPHAASVAEKVMGHTLEIVPIGDPIEPPAGSPLGLRLLFEGQPLAGAQVRRVSLDDAARADERSLTDAQGTAWFPAAGAGQWMLAAVWSRALAQPAPVSYETFFASFTYAARSGNQHAAHDQAGC